MTVDDVVSITLAFQAGKKTYTCRTTNRGRFAAGNIINSQLSPCIDQKNPRIRTIFQSNSFTMAPKLHLYGIAGSCSMAPHILLNEAGLDHDKTIWQLSEFLANGGFSDELKALNPKAKVPVIQVDDQVVTENIAIFTLISQLAPEKHFLGKAPLDTVRVYEWLSYLSGTLHGRAYGMLLRPERYVDDAELKSHVLGPAKQAVEESYKYVEERLEGKKWAVGDDFTVVDAYLFVFYQWGGKMAQLNMEKDYPNYARLVAEVGKRPAVQAMLKAEGLI